MPATAFVAGLTHTLPRPDPAPHATPRSLRLTTFLAPRVYARLPSPPPPPPPPPPARSPRALPALLSARTPAARDVATAPATAPARILISGAPASGKGTQCEYIVSTYGVVHISTGDMLRAAVKAATALGVEAKSYMDAGRLVPDDLVISMLRDRITQPDCVASGWLLDGFPRTAVQARALSEAGIEPTAVVVLQVHDDVLVERVVGRRHDPVTGKIYHVSFAPPEDPEVEARLAQRSDDTEEKARVRLATYYEHAKAIQDHYGGMVNVVEGNRSKAEVFDDISNIIDASYREIDDEDSSALGETGGNAMATATGEREASTRGLPVAEFVRRAEEAYEKGVLEDEDVNWSGQAAPDSPSSAGNSTHADILRRLDLVAGDIFALLAFVYVGRASHGAKTLDLEILKTAAPFVVTWLAVSPLLGGYTLAATSNLSSALKTLTRSWAVAVPMGLGLRGVLTNHVPPVPFTLVTLVSTYLFIGTWRATYVKLRGDETDAERRGGIIEGLKMVTTLLRRW